MIRKWLARRQKRECPQVLEALRAFEANHELGDDELLILFYNADLKRHLAHQLLLFAPIAYGRACYRLKGVKFADRFLLWDPETNERLTRSFRDESVFVEALARAEERLASGNNVEAVQGVAARSVELDGIEKLTSQGSKLSNIMLVEPIIESEPQMKAEYCDNELELVRSHLETRGESATRQGSRIQLGFTDDICVRINSTAYSEEEKIHTVCAELELFVDPRQNPGIRFRALGRGDTEEDALQNFVDVWSHCMLPVVKTAICPGAQPGVRCNHFHTMGMSWATLAGEPALYMLGNNEPLREELSVLACGDTIVTLLQPELERALLPARANWLVYYASNVNGQTMTEALLNNESWSEGADALKGIRWPRPEEFSALRGVWLIMPENQPKTEATSSPDV
jgi:hypothetical protein